MVGRVGVAANRKLTIRFSKAARKRLAARRPSRVVVTLTATVTDAAGNRSRATLRVTLVR